MSPFRRARRSSSKRRKMHWEEARADSGGILTHNAAGGGLSTVQVGWIREPAGRLSQTNLMVQDDVTLIRSLVNWSASFVGVTNFQSPWTGPRSPCRAYFGVGMLVWEGLDTNTTPSFLDVPWPVSGAGLGDSADWLYKVVNPFSSIPVDSFCSPVGSPELGTSSRAMRKLSSGSGILLVTELLVREAAVDLGSMYYTWSYHHRQLFKDP